MNDRACNSERRQARLLKMAKESGYHAGKMATLCGISLRQLERYCREDFGCTPSQWLKKLRLEHAPELLRENGHVGKAARKLGYTKATNFSRHFTSVYGATPSAFFRSAELGS